MSVDLYRASIDGFPHMAEFVAFELDQTPVDASEQVGATYAYLAVNPPFIGSDQLFRDSDDRVTGLKMTHYATTAARTVVAIEVGDINAEEPKESLSTHEKRTVVAEEAARWLIIRLNELDSGTITNV